MTAPSGRSQEIAQAAGLAEESVPFDALKEWKWRVYRAIWNRVRQFWTGEKWIRVTDDENNLRWVPLNRPVPRWEEMARIAEEQGKPLPPEVIEQLKADPKTQDQVRTENQLAELDVDIVVDDGPDSVTVQSEQYQQLIELKKAAPNEIPTKLVIHASQLRNKEQLLEATKELEQAKADRAIEAAKVEIDRYKAETERMKVIADANRPPPQPQQAIPA